MTAQRKTTFAIASSDISALHSGVGVEMFSSGSAPSATDCMMGDATALFSSGSAPLLRADTTAGDAVEMFSSGSAPVTAKVALGDVTGLFSSGS